MAVTQNELITALQTLLSTNPVRLAMRSGTAASLDLADLVVGEIAVATDTLQVWVCTALGTVIQLTGLNLLGYYATSGALATAHPAGTAGQVYVVGSAPTHLYTWGSVAWVDLGAMNDVSTFATLASPTFTGSVIVPTPTTDGQASNKGYVDGRMVYGTWTPTIVGSTVSGSNTYSTQVGIYTKIGRLVHIEFSLTMSEMDSAMSGARISIGGLPFGSSLSGCAGCVLSTVYGITMPAAYQNQIAASISGTGIGFMAFSNGSFDNIPVSGIAAGAYVRGSADYMTAE